MLNSATIDSLQRLLYREFLLEDGLYLEAGLEDLPARVAKVLGCAVEEAVARLIEGPGLETIDMELLRRLFTVRDMTLTSRTAASVSQELKDSSAPYEACIRTALVYAVAGLPGHVFSALRVAASHDDSWARHHHLYGLILGLQQNLDRACWELDKALESEPYEAGRQRIQHALDALRRCAKADHPPHGRSRSTGGR